MKFLIATQDENTLEASKAALGENHELVFAGNRLSAMEAAKSVRFDICFWDLEFLKGGQSSPAEVLKQLRAQHLDARIVLLCSQDSLREVGEILRTQADNYLTYPIEPLELNLVIEKTIRQERRLAELNHFRDQFWDEEAVELVQTSCARMNKVFEQVRDVAPTRSTVLLEGETGVGKGVIARLVHRHSTRKGQQFIHVHCGALADSLVESELFGHEQGAFTGAVKRKIGKFELSDKGTIFLDEISTLSPSAQVKLLQVLQDGVFQRVGGDTDIVVDVRVIAATNENLADLVSKGTFRKDLYFRLNVFPVEIPPLRERLEDLPKIMDSLLNRMRKSYPKEINGIQEELICALQQYDWPGNIRELENLVERAYIIEKTKVLRNESFPEELFRRGEEQAILPLNLELPLSEARHRMIENFERQYLIELLSGTQGRISEAAERAGVGVRQLNKLMNKYDLRKEVFRTGENSSKGIH